MRQAILVTLSLFLVIALFPVNRDTVYVPWGESRWAFIAVVDEVDWSIMALECIIALVIGGIIAAVKRE